MTKAICHSEYKDINTIGEKVKLNIPVIIKNYTSQGLLTEEFKKWLNDNNDTIFIVSSTSIDGCFVNDEEGRYYTFDELIKI